MIPAIWYRWLQVAVGILMIFGISMVLAPDWIRTFFSLIVYGSPGAIETGFPAGANDYIVLVHGVLGAVMFGWGLTLLLVLMGPFRRGEKEGWNMFALPASPGSRASPIPRTASSSSAPRETWPAASSCPWNCTFNNISIFFFINFTSYFLT